MWDHRLKRIFYVTSYLPRQCGIATYTECLADAVRQVGGGDFRIVALTDRPEGYDYPDVVEFEIRANDLRDYRRAADYINFSTADVVSLQHEFNLYGGPGGSYICELLANLRRPVVTTLHTVEKEPDPDHRATLTEVCRLSNSLVVMNPLAVDILADLYDVPPEKVSVIHHGVPDVPFVDPAYYKDVFGVAGRFVLLTFGLLHPGKGIETVIQALPPLVQRHPEVVYIVLGATHPVIRRQQGEAYRLKLQNLAAELGVADHVLFVNRFVSNDELFRFLQAADVYVTPYLSKDQMTSGTLAYAVGMGKAVVSTPYWHAQALLADGRGRLFEPGDHEALAAILEDLLENEAERHAMRKRAYEYARSMVWREVGRQYLEVFDRAMSAYRAEPRPTARLRPKKNLTGALPEVKLEHLQRLTDDTGLIRHSVWGVPNRRFGYATADAARGLVVALRHHKQFQRPEVLELAVRYLAFLYFAQERDGTLVPFLTYDRRPSEHPPGPSQETSSNGKAREQATATALWALGEAVFLAPNDSLRAVSRELFERASSFRPSTPLGEALGLIGLSYYLRHYPGATEARRRASALADSLAHRYRAHSDERWHWFDEVVSRGYAKLPEACLRAGMVLDRPDCIRLGLDSLEFLTWHLDTGDHLDLIGDQGWLRRGGEKAVFAQQPVDAGYLTEAYLAAWEATGTRRYLELGRKALWWFLGKNRLQADVYDFATGACCDGLDQEGVNQNRGAEATLAFLLANLALWAASDPRHRGESVPGPKKENRKSPRPAGGDIFGETANRRRMP